MAFCLPRWPFGYPEGKSPRHSGRHQESSEGDSYEFARICNSYRKRKNAKCRPKEEFRDRTLKSSSLNRQSSDKIRRRDSSFSLSSSGIVSNNNGSSLSSNALLYLCNIVQKVFLFMSDKNGSSSRSTANSPVTLKKIKASKKKWRFSLSQSFAQWAILFVFFGVLITFALNFFFHKDVLKNTSGGLSFDTLDDHEVGKKNKEERGEGKGTKYVAFGNVRSHQRPHICLDLLNATTIKGNTIGCYPCHDVQLVDAQSFVLDGKKNQIRLLSDFTVCVGKDLTLQQCSDASLTSHFIFSAEGQIMWKDPLSKETNCFSLLENSVTNSFIRLLPCDASDKRQFWDAIFIRSQELKKNSNLFRAIIALFSDDKKSKVLDYQGSSVWEKYVEVGSRGWINSLKVLEGESEMRMHGIVGRLKTGENWWKPKPMPLPMSHPRVNSAAELWNGNGYYLNLSWALPLDRDAPDGRDRVCRDVVYDYQALISEVEASIVIVFYNEPLPNLLRTVHSILNRTPPPLLREIILVSDGSTLPENRIRGPLGDALKFIPKVRMIHMDKNVGVVKARLAGIREAKAPVFVILDSHVEVSSVWLEPMLDRIRQSPRALVMPQIDSIDSETFQFSNKYGIGCWLSFSWNLRDRGLLTGISVTTDPILSPCIAGGLYAMRRDWFWQLKGYDEGFKGWGAENIELPFRVWMCGGSIECIVCSRAYHLFRVGHEGYSSRSANLWRNKMRTAALWMGEWAEITRQILERDRPNEKVTIGNVDKMLALKKQLQCKSFQWYLKTTDPENVLVNINNLFAVTEIRNLYYSNICLDPLASHKPDKKYGLHICDKTLGRQLFLVVQIPGHLSVIMLSQMDFFCLNEDGRTLDCRFTNQVANFIFHEYDRRITWTNPKTHKITCMTLEENDLGKAQIAFRPCRIDDPEQSWIWQPFVPNPPEWLSKVTGVTKNMYANRNLAS